jgi:hypothetical protein
MEQRSYFKLATFVAIAGVALAVGYSLRLRLNNRARLENAAVVTVDSEASIHSESENPELDPELRELSPSELASVPRPPAVVQSSSRVGASSATPRPEASPYTRQLIGGLTNLNLSAGPITAERAEQWKHELQTLIGHGATAVPAIRDFLELNQELNFAGINGGQLLGETSLRAALINALGQIGGPEALQLMLQTMQATTLPSEIALLAQHLETLAPGQHRQNTLDAVNDVLAMAAKGQLAGSDMAPLFQLLQGYGDSGTAVMLDQLQGPWRYYATLSLASLTEGLGVPMLIQQVEDQTRPRDFAYQMLAQVATENPEAARTLLNQAQLNQISESGWRKILSGLAGDQYQLGSPAQTRVPPPGLKTYHIASGNQNFYSLPVGPNAPVRERVAFIDQLLAVTSNPGAVQALQAARVNLSGLLSN